MTIRHERDGQIVGEVSRRRLAAAIDRLDGLRERIIGAAGRLAVEVTHAADTIIVRCMLDGKERWTWMDSRPRVAAQVALRWLRQLAD